MTREDDMRVIGTAATAHRIELIDWDTFTSSAADERTTARTSTTEGS